MTQKTILNVDTCTVDDIKVKEALGILFPGKDINTASISAVVQHGDANVLFGGFYYNNTNEQLNPHLAVPPSGVHGYTYDVTTTNRSIANHLAERISAGLELYVTVDNVNHDEGFSTTGQAPDVPDTERNLTWLEVSVGDPENGSIIDTF